MVHAEREPVGAPLQSQIVGQLPDRLARFEAPAPEAAGDHVARVYDHINAGELDLGNAAIPLMDPRQQQLIGPTAPEGGRPIEPGRVHSEWDMDRVRREANEPVIVACLEPLVGVEPVVRDFQSAVHAELRGDLPEYAAARQAACPRHEVARIDTVGVPHDVAEPDGATVSDPDAGRVYTAGRVGTGRGHRL